MRVILGIDIGTTSISVTAMEQGSGRVLATQTLLNSSRLANRSAWEQDPDRICALILPIYAQLCQTYAVAAIGITCQMHGIVYVDAGGHAVSPLYTWQDERGEAEYCHGLTHRQQLNARTGYEQVQGIATGSITHFYLTGHGALPRRAVKFCTIGDYLAMRLTGAAVPLVHISNAAGFGLFDLAQGCYDVRAIEAAGMDASFFPEIQRGYAVSGYTADAAPVSVALGDNQASFLGAVSDWEHEVLFNLGTGGQISQYSQTATKLSWMESRPFLDRDFITVYTSHCGGRAYAALERFFRQVLELAGVPAHSLYAHMERALLDWQPRPEALCVEPAFCGTRMQPDKRCEISGITLENFTPPDLIHGFLEGICNELMPAFLAFSETGHVLRLVGSGNTIRKNQSFQAMIAQRFGLALRLPNTTEEAAVGAGRFAAHLIGT